MKYGIMISSPGKGVQPIIFTASSYEVIEGLMTEAIKEYNPYKVEAAFHEDRINAYENKLQQHKARLVIINDPEFKGDDVEEDDVEIQMEQV